MGRRLSNLSKCNPHQFCPSMSLLGFPVFCLRSSIVLSCFCEILVNSMTIWSVLKLPKIAWPNPFNLKNIAAYHSQQDDLTARYNKWQCVWLTKPQNWTSNYAPEKWLFLSYYPFIWSIQIFFFLLGGVSILWQHLLLIFNMRSSINSFSWVKSQCNTEINNSWK